MELKDVLLPTCILTNSPSRIDGIELNEEVLHRCFGAELIQEATILLRLQQVVAVTAQNIFHRYFYKKSMKRFDVFTVAQGCVLLSSKIEEEPKMLREVCVIISAPPSIFSIDEIFFVVDIMCISSHVPNEERFEVQVYGNRRRAVFYMEKR